MISIKPALGVSGTVALFASLLTASLSMAPNALAAQTVATGTRYNDHVVTTEWLAAHLDDPNIVVLDVTMNGRSRATRIPGARPFPYRVLSSTTDGISLELPPTDSLRRAAERVGVSSQSRVIVYAEEAPMATRLLLSLRSLGLTRLSYLSGGLPQWVAEGRRVEQGEPIVSAGAIAAAGPNSPSVPIVDAAWILPRLGKSGLSLIDTRTTGEYNGTGNRSGMPSAGHLEGARQLEWEWMFDAKNPLQLKPEAELRTLFNERVRPGDVVVTYCWVGYRASATWFVATALGLDARLYDGSYQDWQRRKLATKAGGTP
jgi:thiosulfate/3-mercaptopyruvate sulfurtransferase